MASGGDSCFTDSTDHDEEDADIRGSSCSSSFAGTAPSAPETPHWAMPPEKNKPPPLLQEQNCGGGTSEVEMMKERFAKLLLGEDMSGGGKGVCSALAISNAITNLCATVFAQLWQLEPLPPAKAAMWRREMDWLLSVGDHVVELVPTWQTFPDGSKVEVMTCRPRADLFINLPALRKLDHMLLEILSSFTDSEFWYVDQGILPVDCDGSASFRRAVGRRSDSKWWLPVPRVPPGGLSDASRKHLEHKRECASQILKAAMSINGGALADMDVPDSYLESLPKTGRSCLGDAIYRHITAEQFTPEHVLDWLDLSTDRRAVEIADRLEGAIHVWRRRMAVTAKPAGGATPRGTARASWGAVMDMIQDADKRELLIERAEGLLTCLRRRRPGMSQTGLDISKIQFNKDVGKSILESYSRVLESLASNIVARIDDLLQVDDLSKHADRLRAITPDEKISCGKFFAAVARPATVARFAGVAVGAKKVDCDTEGGFQGSSRFLF